MMVEDAFNILALGRIRQGYHLILAIFKFISHLLGKNAKILIFQDFSGLRNSKSGLFRTFLDEVIFQDNHP